MARHKPKDPNTPPPFSWTPAKVGWHLRIGRRVHAHVWPASGQFWGCALNPKTHESGPVLGPWPTDDAACRHFQPQQA